MVISTQVLKGILEPCILMIIASQETYGYEIVEKLRSQGLDIGEGTVYPLILRLEKKGLIKSERKKSEIGPIRKYLKISPLGLEEIDSFKREWMEVEKMVESLGGILKDD